MAPSRGTRVALVGPSLDILGGQAVQLDRLRTRLSDVPTLDLTFIPVNPRLPGPLRLLQRITYVRTAVTSIVYIASLFWRVPRLDVVHAFSASYWSFLLAPLPAMLVGRLFRKRVILNYRSGEAPDHLANWPISRAWMRLAHEIVVPSGFLVGVFGEFGLKARVVANFVDATHLGFRERTDLRPVFLSNRNLEALYNVECTLRAFALIQAERPDSQLIVVGDGAQRASLEALARTLELRGVEFVGRVPPERMGAMYERADVYLNSPNIDNMPSSIIEAFACGLPVITTNAGGIPFIVEHERTGLMVAAGDHAAMAAAALRVLRDPALARRLTTAARREVDTRYVWSEVRAAWERVYRPEAAPNANTRASLA